jgi:putative intracellular protease/amidase
VLSSQVEVIVASPNGGEAPLDPSSVEAFKDDAVSTKFLKHSEALWKNTHKLSEFSGKAKEFEGIFFVGGHGRTFPQNHPTCTKH